MYPRPPVVAILGHVDHGKTTLLDFIRKSRLAAKEHGGITQKIGGYEVVTGIKGYKSDRLTFIDTPGHEAFSLLRARGAAVADIAILIIDAKDSIMPQTAESIAHIKNAKIPFVVALNKVDLPEANPAKVEKDLLKYDVQTENNGGQVLALPISAKTGQGVGELLEAILLLSADLALTFDPQHPPQGYVIETKRDRRGIVPSVILKDGQIKVGDIVFARDKKAKVRALINDLNQPLPFVRPSTPVEILGFDELPEVGSLVTATSQPVAPAEAEEPQAAKKTATTLELTALFNAPTGSKKLYLIIKADVQGSLEAVINSLSKNDNVDIILTGVGNIHKSDIFLAKTSGAIIIGFAVEPDPEVKELAKQEKVIIKTYSVIYELLEELNEVADLMKEKEEKAKNLKGEAKVLASFVIEGEKVFGVRLNKGKINLGDELQIFRADDLLGSCKLVSLQIRAKKVAEVKKDQEAGMVFSPVLDIRPGDMVKSIL